MSERETKYSGHKTMPDGSHVPLSHGEAKAIWKSIEANEARKAAAMPTTQEALQVMFDGKDRLRKLGWSDGPYCPKDGSPFAVIQHGSTGIFTGHFVGEDWCSGSIWFEDSSSHPSGVMWKALDKLTEWEEAARQKSARATEQHIEYLGRAFGDHQ